jgi:hypothetical protein
VQKLKGIGGVSAYLLKYLNFKLLWNLQIRGHFVCADCEGVRKARLPGSVYLQIPTHLAEDILFLSRIGVARCIDADPRGLYHK